ncbi:MAG TPA: 30S ribosomal protein S24e [Candidatus Korarchaeota archaeon]|nr:30S ribosomal protein S24e [Candidatus Korarchaeota archaeon]
MELEVIKRRENPLLQREEIIARVRFRGGTPSRKEIREAIAKEIGKPIGNLFIRRIVTEYGKEEVKVHAMAYNSRAFALLIEPDHIIKRNEGEGVSS